MIKTTTMLTMIMMIMMDNDVNEHLVKLDSDKTDQSNEVNDNKPNFRSLVCPLHYAKKEAFIFQIGLPAKASL